ncbi:hypothetical protein E2C01_082123 [Portunus trituberculatus]|uniref:Uncharacterized protein n=1 Tax=Portunus trituberculatus TaxID=210409 RepID=A0A5B7IZY9_PORTR|nr:hypothetical protein [Portunus trituberculatus]
MTHVASESLLAHSQRSTSSVLHDFHTKDGNDVKDEENKKVEVEKEEEEEEDEDGRTGEVQEEMSRRL